MRFREMSLGELVLHANKMDAEIAIGIRRPTDDYYEDEIVLTVKTDKGEFTESLELDDTLNHSSPKQAEDALCRFMDRAIIRAQTVE